MDRNLPLPPDPPLHNITLSIASLYPVPSMPSQPPPAKAPPMELVMRAYNYRSQHYPTVTFAIISGSTAIITRI